MRSAIKLMLVSIISKALMISVAFSQDITFTKENFRNDSKGLNEALDNIGSGNYYYSLGKGGYQLALNYYLKANKFNPDNAVLNYQIGSCYLNTLQKTRCITYFRKAYELDSTVAEDIHFMLGQGYHLNYEFDIAISEYRRFYQTVPAKEKLKWEKIINKKINECVNGKEFVNSPVRVYISNAGEAINSIFPDYCPLISADESVMIYTSKRDNSTGGKQNPEDFQFYEDIYFSGNEAGQWMHCRGIGDPLNTDENDATAGLSSDGQRLLIYKDNNGGDLYECMLSGKTWSKPKPLPKNSVNTKYHESSASYSYEGKTIYFDSDRRNNSNGEHDIFRSTKDEDGEWANVENLGPVINTEYDEISPFIHPDGVTLFFSSRGHKSMGGYDIFKSVYNDSTGWSEPENLGYPINTPDDDIFFVLSANGKRGYYSSAMEGGSGEQDIYVITFLGAEKQPTLCNEDNLLANHTNPDQEIIMQEPVPINKINLTVLKGTIKNGETNQITEASIDVYDNVNNKLIATSTSNSSTGRYVIFLPAGKNYGMSISDVECVFHSENYNVPQNSGYQEFTNDITLPRFDVGSKIVLRNIFFKVNESVFTPESYPELERLIQLLKKCVDMRVEISGHTDSIGNYEANIKLSEERAKNIMEYLIENGIGASRLEYKGMGYLEPVASNATEEGRKKNRRVEFKILNK